MILLAKQQNLERESIHSTRSGMPFLPVCFELRVPKASVSRVGGGSLLSATLLVNLWAGVSLEERLCLPHRQVKASVLLRFQANTFAPSRVGLGTFSLCVDLGLWKQGVCLPVLWQHCGLNPGLPACWANALLLSYPPSPGIVFFHLFSTRETRLLGWIQTKVDFHPWILCPRLWVTLSPLATAAAVLAMGRKLKATSWGGD
jgi:hypothetical protein